LNEDAVGVIHCCWLTAIIHCFSSEFEGQVSGVRRKNVRAEILYGTAPSWNSEPQNIELQNVEGWNRFAQSFLK
jgi:hypothetical protein